MEIKHTTDWIAAVALSIQVFIFWWQARILKRQAEILERHAATLEKHTEIAGVQAQTAQLIGEAIKQQGKVLSDQTTIMERQLDLQRKAESKTERVVLFTAVVDMHGAFDALSAKLSLIQLSNFTQKDDDEVTLYFAKLRQHNSSCMKALMTAVHIPDEDRKYFLDYCRKLSGLSYSGDIRKAIEDVKGVGTIDALFLAKIGNLAKTPSEIFQV